MIRSRSLFGEGKLPLLIEPTSAPASTRDYVTQWVSDEKPWLEQKLLEHGALLFRGFDLHSAECFEQLASAISPQFMSYVRGISPRSRVSGNVYTSTNPGSSSHIPIPLHCEMAYTTIYPATVFFFCQQEPATRGETPLAGTRAIYERIRPDVRDRFIEKHLQFVQNVPSKKRRFYRQTWQTLFETTERDLVEAACREQSIEFRWKANGDLQLIGLRPAVIDHPTTGETVWFNGMQAMHDSWSWEMLRVRDYQAFLRTRLRELYMSTFFSIDNYPKQCFYGDGTPIRRSEIAHVRQVHWREAVVFPWRRGDMLVADNILTAHGRMPFTGERKILAMLGAAHSGAA